MSENKQILALDPGGTTGVALRLKNGTLITSTTKTPKELYELLAQNIFEHVVYEGFMAETITKYGLYTVRLVGAIHGICSVLNIPLTQHMPSYRRPFLQDAKALLAGRRTVIHEVDATAHLLRWEYDEERQDHPVTRDTL